jgi:transcriptional regulator with GAF, ATPase, and Fis domain
LVSEPNSRTLRALNAVMRALLEERDFDRMLSRMMSTVLDVLGAERGYLVSASSSLDVRAVRNWSLEEIQSARGEVSRSIVRDVLRTGRAVRLANALESDYGGALSVQRLRLAAILAAPIEGPRGPLGVIYLESAEQGQFEEDDLALLTEVLEVSGRLLSEVLARMDAEAKAATLESTLSAERWGGLITAHPAMEALLDTVAQVATSDAAVLIIGESGTGKELIARALHRHSGRAEQAFVTVNCGALSEAVLESELFGHVKGAFTGAMSDRAGLFESAHRGTLFLDEIGEMPTPLQVKLLRALQFGEYKPVGSDQARTADVRIVSATHRDLERAVEAATFRQDLFFRLNTITLEVPPLRERSDDIPLLFRHFSDRLAKRRGVEAPAATPELLEQLLRYPWPGNVRELENEVERLLALSIGRATEIRPELLSRRILEGAGDRKDPRSLGARVDAEEKTAIEEALALENNNRTRAAKRLGISRETLRLHMRRLGIS